MLKALLYGSVLSALTISAAWALPASPASQPSDISTSNVIQVGKWDNHGKGHWRGRNRGWRGHHRGWRGYHHRGRYWRHRYHYRPRGIFGCVQVGPVWYCP
jgi:hypothetical protein